MSFERDHDHLPVRLGLDEEVDQLVEDRLGIEIFLGLVDHQRPVVAVVQRQIEAAEERYRGCQATTCGCRRHHDAIIVDAIADAGLERWLAVFRQWFKDMRAEMRRLAGIQIDDMLKSRLAQLELDSANIQFEIASYGRITEAAQEFLKRLPAIETMALPIKVSDIEARPRRSTALAGVPPTRLLES